MSRTLSVTTNTASQITIQTGDFGTGAGDSYSFYSAAGTAANWPIGEAGLTNWMHGPHSATTAVVPQYDSSNSSGGLYNWDGGSGGSNQDDLSTPCTGTGSSFAVGSTASGATTPPGTANGACQIVHIKGATGTTYEIESAWTIWASGRVGLQKKAIHVGSNQIFGSVSMLTAAVSSPTGNASASGAAVYLTNGSTVGLAALSYQGSNLFGHISTTTGNNGNGTYYSAGNPSGITQSGALFTIGFWTAGYDATLTATVRDAMAADYTTHGAGGSSPATNGLLVTTGTGVQSWTDVLGTSVTSRASFYDEQYSAYRVAAASNHVNVGGTAAQWGIAGSVTARFSPAFIVSGWTDTGATPAVTYNGTALVSGTDFIAYNDTTAQVLWLCLLFDVGSGGVRTSTNASGVGALDISASGGTITASPSPGHAVAGGTASIVGVITSLPPGPAAASGSAPSAIVAGTTTGLASASGSATALVVSFASGTGSSIASGSSATSLLAGSLTGAALAGGVGSASGSQQGSGSGAAQASGSATSTVVAQPVTGGAVAGGVSSALVVARGSGTGAATAGANTPATTLIAAPAVGPALAGGTANPSGTQQGAGTGSALAGGTATSTLASAPNTGPSLAGGSASARVLSFGSGTGASIAAASLSSTTLIAASSSGAATAGGVGNAGSTQQGSGTGAALAGSSATSPAIVAQPLVGTSMAGGSASALVVDLGAGTGTSQASGSASAIIMSAPSSGQALAGGSGTTTQVVEGAGAGAALAGGLAQSSLLIAQATGQALAGGEAAPNGTQLGHGTGNTISGGSAASLVLSFGVGTGTALVAGAPSLMPGLVVLAQDGTVRSSGMGTFTPLVLSAMGSAVAGGTAGGVVFLPLPTRCYLYGASPDGQPVLVGAEEGGQIDAGSVLVARRLGAPVSPGGRFSLPLVPSALTSGNTVYRVHIGPHIWRGTIPSQRRISLADWIALPTTQRVR